MVSPSNNIGYGTISVRGLIVCVARIMFSMKGSEWRRRWQPRLLRLLVRLSASIRLIARSRYWITYFHWVWLCLFAHFVCFPVPWVRLVVHFLTLVSWWCKLGCKTSISKLSPVSHSPWMISSMTAYCQIIEPVSWWSLVSVRIWCSFNLIKCSTYDLLVGSMVDVVVQVATDQIRPSSINFWSFRTLIGRLQLPHTHRTFDQVRALHTKGSRLCFECQQPFQWQWLNSFGRSVNSCLHGKNWGEWSVFHSN